MDDEADEIFAALVRDWKRIQQMTPQEKVDRHCRLMARGGVTVSDEDKAKLLGEFIREAAGKAH